MTLSYFHCQFLFKYLPFMCQYLGDICSFIRKFWESPSCHSQRRCQELCHENYVKIYGKCHRRLNLNNFEMLQLTLYIPQIFKENLVQQVKTEAQIQVMCDHHPFLVRGPFRWQNKRNLFIGNCVQSCSIESSRNVLDESRTFESVSVLCTTKGQ